MHQLAENWLPIVVSRDALTMSEVDRTVTQVTASGVNHTLQITTYNDVAELWIGTCGTQAVQIKEPKEGVFQIRFFPQPVLDPYLDAADEFEGSEFDLRSTSRCRKLVENTLWVVAASGMAVAVGNFIAGIFK